MNEIPQWAIDLEKRCETLQAQNIAIQSQNIGIREELDKLVTAVSTIMDAVDKISEQAGPLIAQVSESPIIRMLGGKKKS